MGRAFPEIAIWTFMLADRMSRVARESQEHPAPAPCATIILIALQTAVVATLKNKNK